MASVKKLIGYLALHKRCLVIEQHFHVGHLLLQAIHRSFSLLDKHCSSVIGKAISCGVAVAEVAYHPVGHDTRVASAERILPVASASVYHLPSFLFSLVQSFNPLSRRVGSFIQLLRSLPTVKLRWMDGQSGWAKREVSLFGLGKLGLPVPVRCAWAREPGLVGKG